MTRLHEKILNWLEEQDKRLAKYGIVAEPFYEPEEKALLIQFSIDKEDELTGDAVSVILRVASIPDSANSFKKAKEYLREEINSAIRFAKKYVN